MFERHEKLLSGCMEKISKLKVMVAGIGGLGSTVSELLVRTGVGNLTLVDYKKVDEPDLNRQILYTEKDIGKFKVDVAEEKLRGISKRVEINKVRFPIDENFKMPDIDVIVDCLDNFKSRYILEEKAYWKRIPLVHGGVKEFAGQVTTIYPHKTKRLKEIFGIVEDDPFSPQVFPAVVTLVASIQASEVVKIACGDEDGSLMNRLLTLDLSINSFDIVYI